MSCLNRNLSSEIKKWYDFFLIFVFYVFQDFCYYANTIFLVDLLFYSKNEKLFMVCFSFAEVGMQSLAVWHLGGRMVHVSTLWLIQVLLQGPLAWALIVWRCSLVFSSVDKIVSVLIHLLPGELNSIYQHFSLSKQHNLENQRMLLWCLLTFVQWSKCLIVSASVVCVWQAQNFRS